MITVAYNDSIALQIKDKTPLNTQQLTQDLKNEVDLLLKKVEYQEQTIDQLQHMLLEARRIDLVLSQRNLTINSKAS